jgi:hypothetical protein
MLVPVYFKEIFTTNTQNYLVDPNWSTSDFKNILKSNIINDFNIFDFEIVEAGQTVNNMASEYAPAINISDNIKLKNLFGNLKSTSFYIRRINEIENNIINNNNDNEIVECILCCDNNITNNYFGCIHNLCNNCYIECLHINHNRCPYCRQNLVNI